jgi:hypothetical protein
MKEIKSQKSSEMLEMTSVDNVSLTPAKLN